MPITANSPLLRKALLGNAVFSTICGLALVLLSGPVAALLGLGAPGWVLPALGVGLLLFAADLLHQATRPQLSAARARLTCLQDAGWVVGTAVLLLGWPQTFSRIGSFIAIDVALIVASFGLAQWIGLRRLQDARAAAATA